MLLRSFVRLLVAGSSASVLPIGRQTRSISSSGIGKCGLGRTLVAFLAYCSRGFVSVGRSVRWRFLSMVTLRVSVPARYVEKSSLLVELIVVFAAGRAAIRRKGNVGDLL